VSEIWRLILETLLHILSSCIHTELRLQDIHREYEPQAGSKNNHKRI